MSAGEKNTSVVDRTESEATATVEMDALSKQTSPEISIVDEELIRDKIYEIRGVKVMLDFDLADIYGYETKGFNRQVKNNLAKFEGDDFMFALTADEYSNILRCKNCTSSWGGARYKPYAFTEQGIYMLMTVLRGDLAVRQSRALVKAFKAMKDTIIENRGAVGQQEYLKLSLQLSDSIHDTMKMRGELNDLGDKMKEVLDKMDEVVMRSEIAPFLLDFGKPEEKREYLIFNGYPAKAAATYMNIYSQAKSTIYIIDNYINLKTLRLLQDVRQGVKVIVFSDNIGRKKLHQSDVDDFRRELPGMSIKFRKTQGKIHDRYIILDYGTGAERMFLCGTSSKDAGSRTTSIMEFLDKEVKLQFHSFIDKLLCGPALTLR